MDALNYGCNPMFKYFFSLMLSSLLCYSSFVGAAETQNNTSSTQTLLNRPIINLGEQLVNQIQTDPTYVSMFKRIYNDNPTPENIINAVNQYKISLQQSSRFDEYMKGNKTALTPDEIHGYQLFKSYGCAACHSGPNFGGTQFKQLGVARNFLIERKTILTSADLGLAEVTQDTKDFYVFRVPALRNVELISPYYHDGSVKSLDEAVKLMGKYQLGVDIPDKDVNSIVAFLKTLTSTSLEKPNSKNGT